MKAPFMGGAFPFPVKYGYANVSRVEAGEAALTGKAVFSLYPHQSHFVLPADAVIALPANVPPERAVLAANMETALNAVWDAQPGPADRIAVVGAGVVGCLVAWLCGRIPGAQVTLCDIDPARATHRQGAWRRLRRAGQSARRLRSCRPCQRHPARIVGGDWAGRQRSLDTRTELVRGRGDAGFAGRLFS